MKGANFLVVFFFGAAIAFAEDSAGRTDVFYDSGRNVIYATASSNPDYNTQYYYQVRMTTYLTKMGLTQSMGWWGWSESESGPGSVYAEAPAEAGVEFTATTDHSAVIRYMTYEVVPGCFDCFDWYDIYGYFSVSSAGDLIGEGPNYSLWWWLAPVIVARVLEEVIPLGESGGKQRTPGEAVDFDLAVRSFIPPVWIDGPDSCTRDGQSFLNYIYKGDKRSFTRFTYDLRTHSSVILLPDQGWYVSTSKFNLTGRTEKFEKSSGLAADGQTLLYDQTRNDCFKWIDSAYGSTNAMQIDVSGNAGSRYSEARFHGGAADPLVTPSPEINWDVNLRVSKANPVFPTYFLQFTHDCFPAFEVYIGGQRVHHWTPTSYSTITLTRCLTGFGQITGGPTSGTVFP